MSGMSISTVGQMPPHDDNPFPLRAAAEPETFTGDVVTVPTQAIEDADGLLAAYLIEHDRGDVLAVSGEHGTGKTHLAAHLLRQIRERVGHDCEFAYVEAQEGGFRETYRGNFLLRFNRADMVRRIREYYADIVADSLQGSGFPLAVTERVRSTNIDPQRFVSRFKLAESVFLEELNQRLGDVTHNKEFSTALTLLMRGDLGDLVWEWLRGEEPADALRDHGITTTIDDDAQALEAMNVIALLYRGRSRRFVLVIDELHKVMPSSSALSPRVVEGVQRLITQAMDQGIFLILSGLPEFVHLFTDQNYGSTKFLHTDQLDAGQVRTYIEQSMARTRYGPGLGPFTAGIVDRITGYSGGNPRRVITICHACYKMALDTGLVDESMVERAVRGRYETFTQGFVRQRIAEELRHRGIAYHTNHPVAEPDGPRAPYFVPVETGYAIFVTDSLTHEDGEAARVSRDADAVRDAARGCMTLLVVNGFLSDLVLENLESHFSERPLIFDSENFSNEFQWLLDRVEERLGASNDDLAQIKASIGRLSAAQSNTQYTLETLRTAIETTRKTSAQQYAALVRDLRETGHDASVRPLPAEVEQIFAEVLTALRELIGLDDVLPEVFGGAAAQFAPQMLLRLDNPAIVQAIGVAALAERTILAFRSAARSWYETVTGESPTGEQRGDLNALRRSYETVISELATSRLRTLAEQAQRSTSPVGVGQVTQNIPARITDLGMEVERFFARRGPWS